MEVDYGTYVNAVGRIQPSQKTLGRDHGPKIFSRQSTSTGWSVGADGIGVDVWSKLSERDIQIRRYSSGAAERFGIETQSIGGNAFEAAENGVGVRSARGVVEICDGTIGVSWEEC